MAPSSEYWDITRIDLSNAISVYSTWIGGRYVSCDIPVRHKVETKNKGLPGLLKKKCYLLGNLTTKRL